MFRSWMFVPGSQDKHLKKAEELNADVLIFDLEDAVSEKDKEKARLKVKDCIGKIKGRLSFIRVNALLTSHFLEDVSEIVSGDLAGIVLPKVNSKEDIKVADYILGQLEMKHNLPKGSILIVPIIESASGLYNSYDIAIASGRVHCLSFGAEDFMLDLTIDSQQDQSELLYARSKLVTESRAAGKEAPIDSVYTNIENDKGLEESSKMGKKLGFQGKLVIHPKQIDLVNKIYSPTLEQIKEARRIVEMYDASFEKGGGAIQVNGKMVDIPVAERARKLLSKIDV